MKTLAIYITFPNGDNEEIERERRYITEGLWEYDGKISVMHQYRKATKEEVEEFKATHTDR